MTPETGPPAERGAAIIRTEHPAKDGIGPLVWQERYSGDFGVWQIDAPASAAAGLEADAAAVDRLMDQARPGLDDALWWQLHHAISTLRGGVWLNLAARVLHALEITSDCDQIVIARGDPGPLPAPIVPQLGTRRCRRCYHRNPEVAAYCSACGHRTRRSRRLRRLAVVLSIVLFAAGVLLGLALAWAVRKAVRR